jgi:hypothetical protein
MLKILVKFYEHYEFQNGGSVKIEKKTLNINKNRNKTQLQCQEFQ